MKGRLELEDLKWVDSQDRSIGLQNCTFHCTDGMRLAGQRWSTRGAQDSRATATEGCIRLLCVHGFMDNCRSFSALLPVLLDQLSRQGMDVEAYAFDLPGHGKSSHTSRDNPPFLTVLNFVYPIAEVVRILGWNRSASGSAMAPTKKDEGFVLMGHSMGGMLSMLYASSFPEDVQRLILLDAFGPEIQRSNKAVRFLRRNIDQRLLGNQKDASMLKVYPTLDSAIEARQRTAVKSPGNQWISYAAAKEIVEWGIKQLPVQTGGTSPGWQFQHDPRCKWMEMHAFSKEQAYSYWTALRTANMPVLWLRAKDGFPFPAYWIQKAEEVLGDCATHKILPGSHHFHADPETLHFVASEISQALLPVARSRL